MGSKSSQSSKQSVDNTYNTDNSVTQLDYEFDLDTDIDESVNDSLIAGGDLTFTDQGAIGEAFNFASDSFGDALDAQSENIASTITGVIETQEQALDFGADTVEVNAALAELAIRDSLDFGADTLETGFNFGESALGEVSDIVAQSYDYSEASQEGVFDFASESQGNAFGFASDSQDNAFALAQGALADSIDAIDANANTTLDTIGGAFTSAINFTEKALAQTRSDSVQSFETLIKGVALVGSIAALALLVKKSRG